MIKARCNKIFSVALASALVVSTLSGCNSNTENEVKDYIESSNSAKIVSESTIESSESIEENIEITSILEYVSSNYAASSVSESFNEPLYNLENNHVFTFECSEQAGNLVHDAFKVYDSIDFSSGRTFNKNNYSNGIITISPDSVIKLNEKGSRDIKDGTWGDLNQLYLVQYINLDTGEYLENPIVTPFTIKHALKAPALNQSIDSNNNYELSWSEVEGADKYIVFEYCGNTNYTIVAVTDKTRLSVKEFNNQKKDNNYDKLIKEELSSYGYKVDTIGVHHMNSSLKYDETIENYFYVVKAISSTDSTLESGISNIVDIRDIDNRLPYKVSNNIIDINIESVLDIPTYIDVEMLDGSIAQMVIDYHGAQTYVYPDDELKMSIKARVANTEFDSFIVMLHGMAYEDIMTDIGYVTERQDKLLEKVSVGEQSNITVDITDENSGIGLPSTDENTEDTSTSELKEEENKSLPLQLAAKVSSNIEERINTIGMNKLNKVMYSNSKIEAWISYCLIAQSEIIPLPIETFNEAANLEYVFEVFMEAYRQNPTCGLIDISEVKYNTEYQALIINYIEDSNSRFDKTIKEIDKAIEVAEEVCNESMTEYDKVLALNEYFRQNCSYDINSAETDVDIHNLSEEFLDSHAPIGILCNNYGVCESYSEAFVLAARAAGLNAMCETGTIYGGPHEWNRVQVEGKWCILDITNNDMDEVQNGLMNVTDNQVAGILVPDTVAIHNDDNVKALDNSNEYYLVNNKEANSLVDATDKLVEQLNSNNYATLRFPVETSKEDIQAVVTTIINDKGIKLNKAYVQFGVLYVSK